MVVMEFRMILKRAEQKALELLLRDCDSEDYSTSDGGGGNDVI